MAAFLPALISAGGAIGSAYLSRDRGQKKSKLQKSQESMIMDLINSLSGGGSYSDLFNVDEASFNKSFVEPAMAKFRNQIAPNIQQQYIASGQQRGSGLDDTLTRAGVDMDAMLNQYLFQAQQQAQQNKLAGLKDIMGMNFAPEQRQMGAGSTAGLGALGFIKENPNFLNDIIKGGGAQNILQRIGFSG